VNVLNMVAGRYGSYFHVFITNLPPLIYFVNMGLETIENGINSQILKILNENPKILNLCVLLYEFIPSYGL